MADRPRFANEHQALADVARHLAALETEEMRQQVEGGHVTREVALAHVRVLRAIAAGWAAIAALEPEPDWFRDPARRGAWRTERTPALEQAVARAQARADLAPHDADLAAIAEAAACLLWWETATPSARWLADTTIALRAAAAEARGAEQPQLRFAA